MPGEQTVPLARYVAEHGLALTRFGYLVAGDRGRAEDLVQEVYLALYRRFGDRVPADLPIGYARTAIVRAQISHGRRRRFVERPTAELPERAAPADRPGRLRPALEPAGRPEPPTTLRASAALPLRLLGLRDRRDAGLPTGHRSQPGRPRAGRPARRPCGHRSGRRVLMTRFDGPFDTDQPADELADELRRMLARREADITEPARPRMEDERLALPPHRMHQVVELPGGWTGTLLAAAAVVLLVLGSVVAIREFGPSSAPTTNQPGIVRPTQHVRSGPEFGVAVSLVLNVAPNLAGPDRLRLPAGLAGLDLGRPDRGGSTAELSDLGGSGRHLPDAAERDRSGSRRRDRFHPPGAGDLRQNPVAAPPSGPPPTPSMTTPMSARTRPPPHTGWCSG